VQIDVEEERDRRGRPTSRHPRKTNGETRVHALVVEGAKADADFPLDKPPRPRSAPIVSQGTAALTDVAPGATGPGL
jgi:hypothetical protein